jgi:hypothetical protein
MAIDLNKTAETVEVKYELNADDYVKGSKQVQKASDETSKDIVDNNEKTDDSFQKLKVSTVLWVTTAVVAITKVIGKLKAAADRTNEYTMSMRGLNEVSKAYGQDGGAAQKMAKEIEEMSKGMVSASQAAQGLKFLISSGYSLDKASEMSKALLNVGAFNNVVGDLGQAFVDSAKGIKTGSIELIENIGLTEKLSSVMKRAGVDTSNGIDITNNAAQAQALYNSVMNQGEIFQGNLEEATKGNIAAQAEFDIVIDKIIRKLGDKVAPMFANIYRAGTELLEPLAKGSEEATEELLPLISKMEELQGKTELTKDEQEELLEVMNQISLISPEMVTGYDDQGNAIINLAIATKELIDLKIIELELENQELENINEKEKKELEVANKKIERVNRHIDRLVKSEKTTFGLDKEGTESARKRIEAEENEEKRAFVENKKRLDYNIRMNNYRIEQNKLLIETLKETSTLEGYKTAITPTSDPAQEKEKAEKEAAKEREKQKKEETKQRVAESKREATALSIRTENRLKEYEKELKEKQKLDEKAQREKERKHEKDLKDIEKFEEEARDARWEAYEKSKKQQEKVTKDKKDHDKKMQDMAEDVAKDIKKHEADIYAVVEQSNKKQEAVSESRIAVKKAENQLVDDLLKGQVRAGEDYVKIITKEVQSTLTAIAVESGIQSIYNLAKGFAFAAVGKADSATAAFTASATFATTAAAAGLGAVASSEVNQAIGTTSHEMEAGKKTKTTADVPTNSDTNNVIDTTKDAIDVNQTIYISQADYKKMRFGMVDEINEALKDGKKLAVRK